MSKVTEIQCKLWASGHICSFAQGFAWATERVQASTEKKSYWCKSRLLTCLSGEWLMRTLGLWLSCGINTACWCWWGLFTWKLWASGIHLVSLLMRERLFKIARATHNRFLMLPNSPSYSRRAQNMLITKESVLVFYRARWTTDKGRDVQCQGSEEARDF